MHNGIAARVERAIEEKVFPGCVIGTIRANGSREIFPFGCLTYEPDAPAVSEDTIYDVASITKSISTASLIATYIAEGKISLSDTATQYIPELQNDYGATIEDLLTYRVQGIRLSTLGNKSADDILTAICAHGFNAPPGESIYTNLPALLLGVILKRVTGEHLDRLARKRFLEPFEMNHTTFFPSPTDCAPTEIDSRGIVCGLPHDESAYVFANARRVAGHAGLFSTAPDILNFLEALLNRDTRLVPVAEGAQKGWGWQLSDARFMGRHAGLRTFGKTGFTGTSIVCDIERGIGFVILSNRTYPHRPVDDSAISSFRVDVADIVLR